jgi:molecular chaperone GrpE
MSDNKDKIEYVNEDSDEPDKKVKKVKHQLKHCEQERAEYLAGWQRAKADYINLEKRTEQEKSEWIKFSNAELILKFLPLLDSFEEALKHTNDNGLAHIYNQLKDILKNQGLEEIKSLGEKFNPEIHEAVENEKGEKEGIIVEEIQKGYKLHGKIIRPSRVKISK